MTCSNRFIIISIIFISITLTIPSASAYDYFNPEIIILDNSGNIFALIEGNETISNNIHIFTEDGNETFIPISNIVDITADDQGNLYLLNESLYYDQRNISVIKYDSYGNKNIIFNNNSSVYHPGYVIGSIAVDGFGNLYIFDFYTLQNYTSDHFGAWLGDPIPGTMHIVKLDPNGSISKEYVWDQTPSLLGTIKMSVDENGTIYVADYSSNIRIIYPNNTIKFLINPIFINSHYIINDVVVGSDGYIYTAEGFNKYDNAGLYKGRVRKFDPNGSLIASWNGCGTEPFINAKSIDIDNKSRVFVADPSNQRIVWFDSNKYQYRENLSDNVDGKGIFWDNVISGDNFSVSQQKRVEEMINKSQYSIPGFTIIMALTCFTLIIILLYALGMRSKNP